MRRRSLPVDFEGFVQRSQMRLEVRLNAAIRIGPAHDGENGKQQYVRQPIEFALGATRVRDCGEQRQKGLQGLQGDLPSIRSPHTDSDFFAPRNRPLRLSHQELENCCIWDSVESVEQPWGRAEFGLYLRSSVASNPSSTNCRRALPTVLTLVSNAAAISRSVQPSPASDASALSRILAFVISCADRLPELISASSRSRSSALNFTTYFFAPVLVPATNHLHPRPAGAGTEIQKC